MKDDLELLVNDAGPHVDVLLQEFKQAGVMPNGWYDTAFNQEKRRMIWAGQSPDGRKWDENMPEGQKAKPWNGCSDTRVPVIDSIINDDVSVLSAAFEKGDLRAAAVDPDKIDQAGALNAYLHWFVRTKHARELSLETELSVQYSREHGWCLAYVGWERELAKRRVELTIEEVAQFAAAVEAPAVQAQTPQAAQSLAEAISATIMDPEQEAAAVAMLQMVYEVYVERELQGRGFFPEELAQEDVLKLKASTAAKAVRDLRDTGKAKVPISYVSKNKPLIWVCQPYLEVLSARGTMDIQRSRAIFWRRWMTEAELASKAVEGWNEEWIEEAKKTKGNISSWAGALGSMSLTGPSTKTVGNTTYLKVTEENNPLIEVVYGFVKKVDEDGVVGVYQTIFSPHMTSNPNDSTPDFCASHELLDYAHGRYPFVALKRENIGRALTDTRSVPEIAFTWQDESKNQRDMLFNRSQLDTLPPISVPTLGGADYRLGPGAQVPMKRSDKIEAINLGAPPPTLSLELVKMIELQSANYFGQFHAEVQPAQLGAKQSKGARDFFHFWGEILLQAFALQVQYNPGEITRVTGDPTLSQLDPFEIMDQFSIGVDFDVQELNPDFLLKKLAAVHERVLPADAGGVIDRAALTNLELRMLDPRLASKIVMDRGAASQKVYRDVEMQVMKMVLGNEAEYTQNDPTAQMKLQFLQSIIKGNPKYQQAMHQDERFMGLLKNYASNLQMSVMQEQNKQVGRIGVKPVGPGPESVAPPGQSTTQ